jgi:hypothetical protein
VQRASPIADQCHPPVPLDEADVSHPFVASRPALADGPRRIQRVERRAALATEGTLALDPWPIDEALTELDRYLASEGNGPVVYANLGEVAELWSSAGPTSR